MGVYGFVWVWGMYSHWLTNKQHKKDRTDLAGYDSRPCMAGKFPQKRHICVCGQKGVRMDPGGRGWVRMGAGGCNSTQQTQNRANRDTDTSVGHNFGKGVGREITWQRWHMSVTEHMGECWGCKGHPGTHLCTIYRPRCTRARKKEKRNITSKIPSHYKSDQNAKRDKTTQNTPKTNYQSGKTNRKRSTAPIHNNSKAKRGQRQTERSKNCAK